MKNTILVVGSVAVDSVETVHGRAERALGGSAVHFSMAACQFAPISVIGVVGEDFPKKYRAIMDRKNVNLSGLKTMAGKTFHWKGRYDRDFKNAVTIATHLNVFERFKPKLYFFHKMCETLFLANIDPDLQSDVLRQMRKPGLVACDTMNYWISSKKPSLKKLLSKVDIFFVNEEEARQLSGEYNLIKTAGMLFSMGPKVIVIKKGDSGSMLFFEDEILALPAYPVDKVVDPTGAGDTFAGGFMGYLASCGNWRNFDALRRAMTYGTVMSSFNVEDFSVRKTANLTKLEIYTRYVKYVQSLAIN